MGGGHARHQFASLYHNTVHISVFVSGAGVFVTCLLCPTSCKMAVIGEVSSNAIIVFICSNDSSAHLYLTLYPHLITSIDSECGRLLRCFVILHHLEGGGG